MKRIHRLGLVLLLAAAGLGATAVPIPVKVEPTIKVILQGYVAKAGAAENSATTDYGVEVIVRVVDGPKAWQGLHPQAHNAIALVVTDDQGNLVQPVFLAKSDPRAYPSIKVADEIRFNASKLSFLTGTGLCGYDLEKGKTYHVLAIYRPQGLKGPGLASEEILYHRL